VTDRTDPSSSGHGHDAKTARLSLASDDVPVIAVDTLLKDRREAVLVHRGTRYRLRVTSNDKLILTK
jgi:hemin uptake protein HemP